MGLIAVMFLFVAGCLAGFASLIRAGEFFAAGFLAVLFVVALMLFSSVASPGGQFDALKSEIADLKSQIETLKDMANNPAYLAGICLTGASALAALVFCGVYGLMIIQAKIRRTERQEQAERAGYLSQGAGRQALVCRPEPEPVKSLPEYQDDNRYAVMPYQGY
jgi:hypothetical protein